MPCRKTKYRMTKENEVGINELWSHLTFDLFVFFNNLFCQT